MEEKIKDIKGDILNIRYKGKNISINISKELSINENIINTQLKELPSNYAFLCLIRDDYIRKRDILEKELNRTFSEIWLFYKQSDSRLNNDTLNHKTLSNKRYILVEGRYMKIVSKTNKLISICRAYESRERIIQTLAANLRKQQ